MSVTAPLCGTPDQVYKQIADFVEYTGGLGNLLIMAQAGHLNHADTVDYREIVDSATEMKSFAKRQAGSVYAIDRRSV